MRNNTRGELFSHINEVGFFSPKSGGGDSLAVATLPVVGTKDAINVTTGDGADFAVGDFLQVRSKHLRPEINQVASITDDALTPKLRHQRTIPLGAQILAMSQINVGYIREGFRVTFSGTEEQVDADTRALTLAYLQGNLKIEAGFSVLGANLENLAKSLGMLDTSANIAGAGSAADPLRLFLDGLKLDEDSASSWYVNGIRKDGRTMIIQLWDCNMIYQGKSMTLARGSATLLQFQLVPNTVRVLEID